MKKAGGFALLAVLLASVALAAGTVPAARVKVTVLLANVRSAPSSDAPVIMTAESGRVFDVLEKAGEWYLVALPENKKGYLSASIVVEIDETGKPVPVQVSVPAPPSAPRPGEPPAAAAAASGAAAPKLEIGLFGGYAWTSKMGPANYTDNWYYNLLTDVLESTDITVPAAGSSFFGGSLTYYVSPNFGVQVSGGRLSPSLTTASDFTFAWTWDATAGGGSSSQAASWTGTSSLSATIFSLDAVGRFGEGPVTFGLFGGLSLFRCSFRASGTVGYGVTWEAQDGDTTFQGVDALAIPAEIPQTSWTSVGFNLGVGISYRLSSFLALSLEARYYDGGLKELPWTFTPGAYDGLFTGAIKQWPITTDETSYVAAYTTPLPVSLAFFQLTGGIKIAF